MVSGGAALVVGKAVLLANCCRSFVVDTGPTDSKPILFKSVRYCRRSFCWYGPLEKIVEYFDRGWRPWRRSPDYVISFTWHRFADPDLGFVLFLYNHVNHRAECAVREGEARQDRLHQVVYLEPKPTHRDMHSGLSASTAGMHLNESDPAVRRLLSATAD